MTPPDRDRLADGREILYFGDDPDDGQAVASDDPRPRRPAGLAGADSDLPPGELRFDPLAREWVIYAARRQHRTFLPEAEFCPLCASRPGRATEIPAARYDVAVFENRFPALSGAVPGVTAPPGPATAELGAATSGALPGYGRCEVVCFTADHDASFATLSPRRVRTVLAAWTHRTAELGATPGIEHVYCFENRGEDAGATLSHPHGQIYALPFVPPRTRQLLASARAHRKLTGRNLFDDLVDAELADGRRIIARNDGWVAFVPAAARWPFEVMIFPVVRAADLVALDERSGELFSNLYLEVLRRLDVLFGVPMPYLAGWQQAPLRDDAARAEFAAHMHVLALRRAPGRLKYLAGTESGAGVWSNDVLPEEAARMLREASS